MFVCFTFSQAPRIPLHFLCSISAERKSGKTSKSKSILFERPATIPKSPSFFYFVTGGTFPEGKEIIIYFILVFYVHNIFSKGQKPSTYIFYV